MGDGAGVGAMGWRRAVLGVAVTVVSAGGLGAAGPPGVRVDRYDDPLPAGAVGRLGSARLRLHHGVCSLAFSPDRRTLVSFSAAGNVLAVWDVRTGRRVRRIRNPSYSLLLHFSPDGRSSFSRTMRGNWLSGT